MGSAPWRLLVPGVALVPLGLQLVTGLVSVAHCAEDLACWALSRNAVRCRAGFVLRCLCSGPGRTSCLARCHWVEVACLQVCLPRELQVLRASGCCAPGLVRTYFLLEPEQVLLWLSVCFFSPAMLGSLCCPFPPLGDLRDPC